uniref:Alpha-macroglobulin receptor-binding domain-containing protein n=1 Tax=Panagrolaimus sp. ES5 TaxID=591445 RepID=A0AC34F5D0_9BILA
MYAMRSMGAPEMLTPDRNYFSDTPAADSHGSTWLSAFVTKSFKQASSFIFIDSAVIQNAIAFLNSKQTPAGSFAEHGEVHHKDMQGGAKDGGYGLTAYVLVALLENGVNNPMAVEYLENNLDNASNDSYSLAVATYALHLAKSDKASEALKMLEDLQVQESDGGIHWSAKSADETSPSKQDSSIKYFYQPPPVDVEMTSYALLTYMTMNNTEKGLPIVRWLSGQRNANGGFSSTQDTVMALQALGAYAEKAYSPNLSMEFFIESGNENHNFSITNQNAIVLQSYEITNLESSIKIHASGHGVAFAQVQYTYYRQNMRDNTPFFCTKELKEQKSGNRMELNLCCNYTVFGERSNMAVAEIQDLQRVELDKDDTRMNIYFNALDENPICLSLYSNAIYQIADQKPAQIRLYDYYNPEQQLKSDYSTRQTRSLAESCPDCWPEANADETSSTNLQSNGGSSSQIRSTNRASRVFCELNFFMLFVSVILFVLTLARF